MSRITIGNETYFTEEVSGSVPVFVNFSIYFYGSFTEDFNPWEENHGEMWFDRHQSVDNNLWSTIKNVDNVSIEFQDGESDWKAYDGWVELYQEIPR